MRMQSGSVVVLVLVLVVLCLSVFVQGGKKDRGKKGRKKGGKNKNQDVSMWCVSAKSKAMRRGGLVMDCGTGGRGGVDGGGRIASLSIVGVAGECQGLTARMFVDMTSCLWKGKCTIKKAKNDRYMVKLLQGQPVDCIDKQPTYFNISYYCASADVKVLDVIREDTEEEQEDITDRKGIIRSHEDHPWLYKGHFDEQFRPLTLKRPSSDLHIFVYTIRSIRLMYRDNLTVASVGRTNYTTIYTRSNAANSSGDVILGADYVTFQLQTLRSTAGEEGFVICFQWTTDTKMKDACSGIISPGKKQSSFKKCRKWSKKTKKKTDKNGKKNGKKRRKGGSKTGSSNEV